MVEGLRLKDTFLAVLQPLLSKTRVLTGVIVHGSGFRAQRFNHPGQFTYKPCQMFLHAVDSQLTREVMTDSTDRTAVCHTG